MSDIADVLSFSLTEPDWKIHEPASIAFLYPANVPAVMANMTDSMTDTIHTKPYGESTVAAGVVWEMDTYILIKWVWLTFPGALVLLSTIIIVVTALFNSKHKVPLWKSRLLPYLFHGHGDEWWKEDERRQLREGLLEQQYDMECRAKQIKVKLQKTREGETRFIRD